jgi:O-antigen/teichoic acid export membrane protein
MTPKNLVNRLKRYKQDYDVFIKNTSWTSINQVVTILLGIILSVIFARFTSKELFGEYNFLNSMIAIVSIVAIPGLNTSMLRSISRGMDGVYVKAVKLSFMWSLLGVPILFLVGGYYYFFNNQIIGLGLFTGAIFFPLIYSTNNWIALLQGKKKFDIFAKFSIIQSIIRTSTVILAIFSGPTNLIIIFLAFLATGAATNIIFFFKCKQYIENQEEEEGWRRSGYKLSFNDFVTLSYDNLDKILIGIFLGPVELAIYAIAVSIVSALKGSLIQIITVISPSIFSMEKEKLKIYLKKTFPSLILLNIILLIVIILILPFITTLLYSQKYSDSIFFAQVYAITIPLAFILAVLNTSLISLREENVILVSRLLGFILMLILYVVLIPILGIMGAIIASIIYYVSLCIILYHYLTLRW